MGEADLQVIYLRRIGGEDQKSLSYDGENASYFCLLFLPLTDAFKTYQKFKKS